MLTSRQPTPSYVGTFMADDFADKFSTPGRSSDVVGLLYQRQHRCAPATARAEVSHRLRIRCAGQHGQAPSHPGCIPVGCNPVLQYDVVTLGALAPNSGTFTETAVPGGTSPVTGEILYKYNAELHLGHQFNEQPDTVYWLKIAALVDLPPGTPVPPPPGPGITQWGWHNRDYTINDPLASTAAYCEPRRVQ